MAITTVIPPLTINTGHTGTGASSLYGGSGGSFTAGSSNYASINANGNTTVHGVLSAKDIELDGVKLSSTLNSIKDRLCILEPDPKKLEKFAVLKEAYEQYRLLESLLYEDHKDV
jgi:hypothetical protein